MSQVGVNERKKSCMNKKEKIYKMKRNKNNFALFKVILFFRCNRESELSFPGFGSACGGSASSMAYLKSAPYAVPGLGIHGLPVDSLHGTMGYPGK